MTNTQTPAYALDDSTMERAAEAIKIASMYAGCDCETCKQEAMSAVRAALPVIGPKIERAIIVRLVWDSQDWDCSGACDFSGDGEDYEAVFTRQTLARILQSYLPAAEGSAE